MAEKSVISDSHSKICWRPEHRHEVLVQLVQKEYKRRIGQAWCASKCERVSDAESRNK